MFVTLGKSWGICQNVKNRVAGGNWEVCGTTRNVWVPLWAEELPQQRARVGGKHKTKVGNVQAPHVETRAYLFTNCLPFTLKGIRIHQDYFMLNLWRVFNVIAAFLFRTLWRRKLTTLRKPNRGTRGTNTMWAVTMKRRDIWTWSNSWKRRNHGWWVDYKIECCGGCLQSRWNKVLPFPFSQEYETTRKEIESVKKEREEAKKNLSALRHSQAPMVRKIKEIDEQLQPIEDQVKSKVKKKSNTLRGQHSNRNFFFNSYYCTSFYNLSW